MSLTAAQTEQLEQLYQLQAQLNILTKIVDSEEVQNSTKVLPFGATSLYEIAAKEYGDATKWTLIAAANGIDDPETYQAQELIIPADQTGTGGILNGV